MNVKQLIEILEKYDGDEDVVLYGTGPGEYFNVAQVTELQLVQTPFSRIADYVEKDALIDGYLKKCIRIC